MRHRRSNWKLMLAGVVTGALMVMSGALIHTYAVDGEWKQNEQGYWYGYADGTYPKNQWLQIEENWYWFNADGYAATGWVELNGKWYYFSEEHCAMLTGLQEITNAEGVTNTYYLNTNGEMLTGWHRIGTDWHYFGLSSGAMIGTNVHEAGTLKGIDVSKWQGNIDWPAVKEYGIEFAFIRLGHDNHIVDPYYAKNMQEADAAGIPVGVYFYSTAETMAESLSDAQFVIDNLQGYPVSYPVAIDLEDSSQSSKLTKEQITAIGKVFCDEIRKAGYTPMIYCNENWYRNYVDFGSVGDVERWIARYNHSHDASLTKDIWQAGSTTRIAGVNGNVDINFAYKDYTQIVTPRTASIETYVKSTGVWEQDAKGWWYCHLDGSYPKNQWELIEGQWYWFNAEGYESPAVGWQQLENEWYYYDSDGTPADGWRTVSGKWYYMQGNGKMLTGWQNIDEQWYYLGASDDGAMKTGWQEINNKWYYMDTTGKMLTGWQRINGKWYYMDTIGDGRMLTGWQYINDKWYYMDTTGDGKMLTGWQYINNKWYYMDTTGDGKMLTGWQRINGKWYYMDTTGDGRMLTGWQLIDNTWYYMYDSGAMAENTWIGNYYVNGSGAWVTTR